MGLYARLKITVCTELRAVCTGSRNPHDLRKQGFFIVQTMIICLQTMPTVAQTVFFNEANGRESCANTLDGGAHSKNSCANGKPLFENSNNLPCSGIGNLSAAPQVNIALFQDCKSKPIEPLARIPEQKTVQLYRPFEPMNAPFTE
jgi:hypothetical protein